MRGPQEVQGIRGVHSMPNGSSDHPHFTIIELRKEYDRLRSDHATLKIEHSVLEKENAKLRKWREVDALQIAKLREKVAEWESECHPRILELKAEIQQWVLDWADHME